jgi:hypothetical protein
MRKPMTATEPGTLVNVPMGERRLRLVDLPRREALNCTPDELVETSWEWREEGRKWPSCGRTNPEKI